ncbi:MAG: hypothetical protein KGP12_05120 [Actinomycetales bacterium]|nr:hypothetical protein [Actinomycetales bacterium]
MTAPAEVLGLAEQRAAARAAKDWSASDALRDQIAGLGWVVTDGPDGYRLAPRPPYDVAPGLADLRVPVGIPAGSCGIALLVDGWPDDVRACVAALLAHAPADAAIWLLDLGDVDGSGGVVHELAAAHPGRIVELHCAQTLDQAGWGKATARLIELEQAPVHVLMDPSSVLTGDAISPLLRALDEPGVVGAGWQGVDVDVADDWRSFIAAPPGEVDALLGYLMAVRTQAAQATPPHPKARFYRNADLEWSLMLRAAGGRLVVPSADLPVRQDRHRGYHDSDPQVRDRESRRTYDRLLQQFRGRDEIIHPRPAP